MAQCDLCEYVVDDYVTFEEFCEYDLAKVDNLWLLLCRLDSEGAVCCLRITGRRGGDTKVEISPTLYNDWMQSREDDPAAAKLLICPECLGFEEV